MFSRRTMIALSASALAAPALTTKITNPAFAEIKAAGLPVLGDDGIYHLGWYLNSFLELKDDLVETTAKKKRLVLSWELKGCPYCEETQFKNFARPDISRFIHANFEVLQLNYIGSRMVVDIDGEELPEKKLASKYGIRFTPTIQFLDDGDAGEIAARKPRKREVARIQGYIQPDHFLAMFQFVQSRSYDQMSFRKFLKSQKPS